MINPYPYFAYQSDPRPDTLAFCLFQPNAGRVDAGSRIRYTNMFDAQVDAVKSALGRSGYGGVDIVVAETGWPTKGDPTEAGATVDNARAYVSNLVAHLRSGAGTPLMPGKPVDTYLFALYDEDQKPGPTSERSFGLYHTDLSMAYDAGLTSSGSAATPANGAGATVQPKGGSGWCVASAGATDAQLQTDMDYACSQVGVDCGAIQPGGACFQPNTVRAHAAYAMNQLYQAAGGHPWNCDFRQSATLTSSNPSKSPFSVRNFDHCSFIHPNHTHAAHLVRLWLRCSTDRHGEWCHELQCKHCCAHHMCTSTKRTSAFFCSFIHSFVHVTTDIAGASNVQ
jgi:hypothetical protein